MFNSFEQAKKDMVKDAINSFVLPEKLSEALRLAIADMMLVKKDWKNYILDLGNCWYEQRHISKYPAYVKNQTWKGPNYRTVCAVCLAGSVLAKTLQMPKSVSISPSFYALNIYGADQKKNDDLAKFMNAVECFRMKRFKTAFVYWEKNKLTPYKEVICKNLEKNYEWVESTLYYSKELKKFEKAVSYLESQRL